MTLSQVKEWKRLYKVLLSLGLKPFYSTQFSWVSSSQGTNWLIKLLEGSVKLFLFPLSVMTHFGESDGSCIRATSLVFWGTEESPEKRINLNLNKSLLLRCTFFLYKASWFFHSSCNVVGFHYICWHRCSFTLYSLKVMLSW